MQNSFGHFQAGGTVSFTDNSVTFHGVVSDVDELAVLRARARVVEQQVEAAAVRLEPSLATPMRSATDEVAGELAGATPDRDRLGSALTRLAALASGVGAAAGIVESVQSMLSVLGGGA